MPEPGGEAPPRLQLLTRDGCHLCVAAAETLQRLAAEVDAGVGLVDVDTDPELQAEYDGMVSERQALRVGCAVIANPAELEVERPIVRAQCEPRETRPS